VLRLYGSLKFEEKHMVFIMQVVYVKNVNSAGCVPLEVCVGYS
jgi:hypothetical protein